ncbi:MAG: hypothetical protein WBH90_02750 [Aggregatilineales bacterium]|nr:hypothetical protein [Aggregatilineales bacterium]HPV08379.1 hypothetical protein [Aggregatilineales bacterium]
MIKLRLHFLVPKAKYSITVRLQPDLAFLIAGCYVGLIMYGAVKFNDEALLVTVEVYHEPAQHDLPAELRPRLICEIAGAPPRWLQPVSLPDEAACWRL